MIRCYIFFMEAVFILRTASYGCDDDPVSL